MKSPTMTTRRVIHLEVQDNDDHGIEEFDISDHWRGGMVANNQCVTGSPLGLNFLTIVEDDDVNVI